MTEGTCARPLGDVCDIFDSRRKPITKRNRVPGPYPYYGATGVLDYVESYIFDEPLVLIGEDGAKWGAGERTAYAVEGKYWVNNHAHVIRPNRDLMLDSWVIYYLNAIDLAPFISGLTVPKLNQGRLREIPIPLPPLPEQKRIVAILDEAFAGIATAVANTDKNLANARELFESYLNLVFDQQGENWAEMNLGDLCERITKGSSPNWQGIKYQDKPGVLFVTSENVGRNELLFHKKKYVEEAFNKKDAKSVLREGDVLTNIVGASIGRTAVFEMPILANINQAVCLLRCKPEKLNSHFLAYLLNSPFLRHVLHENEIDNARANLSLGFFRQLSVPCPSIANQEEIVRRIDRLAAECKALELICLQKRASLGELKQSLLQKAFSGELTTAPQDEIETALA